MTDNILEVIVPIGKKQGDLFSVKIPGGKEVQIQVPENVKTGEKVQFRIPTADQYFVSSDLASNGVSLPGTQNTMRIPAIPNPPYQQSPASSFPSNTQISVKSTRFIGRTTLAFLCCTPAGFCCIPLCFPCDHHVQIHMQPGPM